MDEPKESISTTDINEAAYYYSKGAALHKVDFKDIWTRKYTQKPKIRQEQWTIRLDEVPKSAIDDWWNSRIVLNLRDYLDKRIEFKKKIWSMRKGAHVNNFMKHL